MKVLELAQSVGMTKEDLAEATGRKGESTFERLLKGQGSMNFAASLKLALKERGADVSQLPPIDESEEEELLPAWKREWIQLGEILHRLATQERFAAEVDRIRKLAEAHALVAGETLEISRPNVSMPDSKHKR